MRAYQVRFLPEAAEELSSLDKPVSQRILKKLKWLAENFADLTPEPLGGELKGLFKLRVGSYRVLYSFNRERRVIYVHLIGHRREIYKLS
ncbi:type II toxin-antitoxin system RelE/ParE family toxin [Candidatus Bipolaricaulota bacterium]|nr:type II toxin-antitoxin system RelE/ParE family toxin [Candidatus Bipolaricaulota bacterium]